MKRKFDWKAVSLSGVAAIIASGSETDRNDMVEESPCLLVVIEPDWSSSERANQTRPSGSYSGFSLSLSLSLQRDARV